MVDTKDDSMAVMTVESSAYLSVAHWAYLMAVMTVASTADRTDAQMAGYLAAEMVYWRAGLTAWTKAGSWGH
jgi:hypothetical protein